MTEKSPHIHWLYLWLLISAGGNVLGLASLVDNVVVWADFFKHVIELYREYIRGPIAFVGNHVWPFGKIPGWFFDVFVLWSIFFISLNIFAYREDKTTMLSITYQEIMDENTIIKKLKALVVILITLFLFPIIFIIQFYAAVIAGDTGVSDPKYAKEVASYVGIIIAIFIIILFINYQILHRH